MIYVVSKKSIQGKGKKRSYITNYFFSKIQLTLIELKNIFIIVYIFHYFDVKFYINIKTAICSNIINEIFSEQTLNNTIQLYSRTFFSKKIISIKTYYKTYNRKLLINLEKLKTWHYFLDIINISFLLL